MSVGTPRANRGGRRAATALCISASVALVGCSMLRERVAPAVVSPALVAEALAGRGSFSRRMPIPAPPEPDHLRPCCAFGLDLKVKVAGIPVPAFSLETVRGPSDLGPHQYGAGLVQLMPSPVQAKDGTPSHENNGTAYTCRGGFIDAAHTRDFADLTWFLASRIQNLLETGGSVRLGELGGARSLAIRALPPDVLRKAGRIPAAVAIAQWATFELSVWREIATWYGHETIPPWSERISSFSLEDLYSNMLGARIAGGILLDDSVGGEVAWDQAMTTWLAVSLEVLGVVPKERAAEAMRAVEGTWWDANRRVPDWKVVERRALKLGPVLTPWLVTADVSPKAQAIGCENAQPMPLSLPRDIGGAAPDELATVHVEVSDKLVRNHFPLPRNGAHNITQNDFPAVVQAIRRDFARELGAGSDRP